MLAYVFDACRPRRRAVIAVVGHGREQVIQAFADQPRVNTGGATAVAWVTQEPQLARPCCHGLREHLQASTTC